jgi:hypothetical protein
MVTIIERLRKKLAQRQMLAKQAPTQAEQAASQPEQAAAQAEQPELPLVSSEENAEAIGKKSITTLLEAAHPEIAELVKNKKLIKKTMTQGTWVFVYLGVHGSMDSVYLKHPCVQELLPRGYYEAYFDGVFVFASHGSDKFHDGQERTAPEAGIEHSITLPNKKLVPSLVRIIGMTPTKLKDIYNAVKFIVSDKRNGKNMTFRLFHKDGKLHCFLASKTTCGVFEVGKPIPHFVNAHGTNVVLINMGNAFMRFWNSISEHSKAKLVDACVRLGFTFMCEYEDGAHIVPHSGLPSLTITMVIKVDQTGHTEHSDMLFRFGGSSLQEWLCGRNKVGLHKKFVVQSKTYTLEEYATPETQKVLHWTNIFKAGEPIEGYVVTILFGGNVVCQFKLKNPVYIILRMIRELLRALIEAGAELNPAKVAFDLHARISGPGAYPSGLSGAAADACCDVAHDFAKFCIRLSTERGISLAEFVSIAGNGDDIEEIDASGMANTMALFVEQNAGFGIPQALALTGDSSGKWKQTPQKTPAAANGASTSGFVPDMGEITAIVAFILSCEADVRKFRLGDVNLTATSYGRQTASNIAPIIILQAISGTGKTTLAEILAKQMNAIIGCADDFFKLNCRGKFIPKLLGQAHEFCRDTVITTSLDQPVIVANTHCNLNDASKYVEYASKTGRPVIIIRLEPIGTFDEFSAKLAERGEHVKETSILAKQWETMTKKDNLVPPTFEALLKRVKLSSASGEASSTAVPKEAAAAKKPATKKPATPYTALSVELSSAFLELFPNTKPETHITLNFGEHVSALLDDPRLNGFQIAIPEVREHIDPDNTDNFIACAVVKSDVLAELQTAGLVKPNLHITLYFGGTFKPFDSNKLMDGSLKPTSIVEVSGEASVCVGTVAAMPLSQ